MQTVATPRDLGAAVRGYRVQRGWSQQELARRARVSRSWLVDVEHGKQTIEMGRVLQVLHALDVELVVAGPGERAPARSRRRRSLQLPTVDLDDHLDGFRSA